MAGYLRDMPRPTLRDQLAERILDLDDVRLATSRFSGAEAFFVGRREFAHFHAGNELDLRLTRAEISRRGAALLEDRRVSRPNPRGDWVEVRFPRRADLDFVLELVAAAREANLGGR